MMQKPGVPAGTLSVPTTDDAQLTALLGAKGYSDDIPLWQFAAWADKVGLFELLATRGAITLEESIALTPFTEAGADAVLGVLASLNLVIREAGVFSLSDLALEYLVPRSPYFVGASLFLTCRESLPAAFIKRSRVSRVGDHLTSLFRRPLKKLRGWEFGGRRILENQHSRNLPSSVTAANLPLFDDAECVVDMAGGSGPFSIPLAQRHPDKRIVLSDLPRALPLIRKFLTRYGVENIIELIGMNVFSNAWPVPDCDAMFFGNFIHGFDDERCKFLLRQSHEKLRPGGILCLHELVWNENKDGPLSAALWNVTMRNFGGKQRTVSELRALLRETGYVRPFEIPTSGGFVMVGGARPHA